MAKNPTKLSLTLALCLASAGWLISCDSQSPSESAEKSAAPGKIDQSAPRSGEPNSPARQLLTEWQAYSYNPPSFGAEVIRLYDDHSCAFLVPAEKTEEECTWKKEQNDRLLLTFAKGNQSVDGKLRPALSVAGRQTPSSAVYLTAAVSNNRTRTFVLLGSPDAQMIQDAIGGQIAWGNSEHDQAISLLSKAMDQGNPYARVRLGWIYATTREHFKPEAALELLSPLKGVSNYWIQDALAAAYAAQGDFAQAVATAEGACKLAGSANQGECEQRLAGYKENKPFLISLKQQ